MDRKRRNSASWKDVRDSYSPVHRTFLRPPKPLPARGAPLGARICDLLLFSTGPTTDGSRQLRGPKASWRRSRDLYNPIPDKQEAPADEGCCIIS
jgi:hypothetical protein